MSKLKARLKEARKNKGVTQIQVMKATGINSKTLGGYENGVSEPDLETLNQLAAFYDVTVDWLMGNTNNPNAVLTDIERTAIEAINLDDKQAFINLPFQRNGKELSAEKKATLWEMAKLLLDQDQ